MNCFTGFSDLTMFHTHICKLYENSKHLLQKDSWSTFTPTQFVNLLLIHHLNKVSTQKQLNIVANIMRENISSSKLNQSYITSNIEDVFKKTDGDNSKGKIVLIEGAPGIGKTMLCKEIAYRWACKKLLHSDNLLLLVFLRDPNIQSINCIEALVQYMYRSKSDKKVINISRSCATHLIETEGANTTIILDGFDELSHLKGENGFLLELLCKNILPLCRIVVSSRPIASKDLQNLADVKVEILGFSEESRHIFINNELKENHDRLDMLKSYLKENSNIDRLCYIPFVLSLLVCIVKECEELPKSQTEIYTKFIIYTISQFLKRLNPPECAIISFNELPSNFKTYFLEICRYAYNALERDVIVFTANEIKNDFPMFANAPGGWSGLGLLKSAEYFSAEENSNCTSYNFLHLSIQEYLAAYHINGLETNQQIRTLKKYFFVDKYLNMWIMYCGMSERSLALEHFLSNRTLKIFTKWFSIDQISKDIMQCKIKRFYLFQCLSEIKNHRVHELVSTLFQEGILDLSDYTLMPKDIDTLIYILNRLSTTHWNELNLSNCNIGDAGCNQLCNALNDTNLNIIFDKLNLSYNQLTIDSIEVIVDIVVHCDTKVLCLSDNFNINSDTKLAYLAMEYAFKYKLQKHPLTIDVYDEESLVFSKLDEQAIIAHLKTIKFIKSTYFINCNINDEMAATITDKITTNKLTQVCVWNSSTSSNVVQQIFSSMLEEVESQLLFVYEDSYSVHLDSVLLTSITAEYVHFTFIFFNTFSLILHSVNDMHAKFMIFSNPLFYFKPEELTEIQISNCNISEDIISLLSQLISQCKLISKYLLLNNVFNIKLLQKLIDAINPLPSLSEVIIEHKSMTTNDCCSIVNMLSSNYSHAVMIFCQSILGAYRCPDKLLNDSDAITSAVKQLCEKEEHIIVYEKNFINDAKHIQDTCKSLPVTYIFLNRTTLLVNNAKDYQVIFIVMDSSFQSNSISEIVFSDCLLHDKWIEIFTQTIMPCKILTKVTFLNSNLNSYIAKILIKRLRTLPLIREIMIYESSLSYVDIYTIVNDLDKNENIAVILMSSKQITAYKCDSNLFSDAVNINYAVSSVTFVFCNVNQYTFQSMAKILCIENVDFFNCAIDMQGIIGHIQLSDSSTSIDTELNETSDLLQVNDNQLRSEGLTSSIASVISKNETLKSASLSNNNLKDDGVIKLTQSLYEHNKLKCINLLSNNITDKAAEALASVISSNPGLEELYLGYNQLQSGVIKIATALENISSLKVLSLNNNNISDEAANALAAAIKSNNSLEKLWLNGNHLGSSIVVVVNALKGFSMLKELGLNDNKNRSEELALALASVIEHNKLTEMLLGDNNLNDHGVIKIAQSLCKSSTLKCINLQSNNITEKAAEALASVISSNTRLEELYLGNNQLQLGVITIANALKNISSIKVLDLRNNNINEQATNELAAVIRANNSLEKLWLNGNYLGSSIVVVVNALKEISTLKELALNDNKNRSEELAFALASVIEHNELIEMLLLRDNNLNDLGVIEIAQSLCKSSTLKCINLQSNNITEKAAEALASVISSNTRLEELYLGNNQLQLGVIKIANALKNISSIKVLDLRNNNINEQATNELAAVIRANNSLEELCLSGNYLGSSIVVVVNALKEISTLKELALNDNKNRSEELALALASVIEHNELIEMLLLRDNNLNDHGVIEIAKSLCKSSTLKCINLQSNNITEKAAEALASVISSNTGLEELYLGNNHLHLGIIKIVIALENVSSLKVLDFQNNNMTEEVGDKLSGVIAANDSVEKLWLTDNNLESSISVIIKVCCHSSCLKELYIRSIGISKESANELFVSVVKCNSLLEISFSENNLQSSGFMIIAQALILMSTLKCLHANSINVKSSVSTELSAIIDQNLLMQEISLGDNLLENGLIQIAESCSRLMNLKVLELAHNQISPMQVVNLVSAVNECSSLELLSLSGICMSINESIYLNIFRIYNKVFYKGLRRSSNVPTEGKLFSNVFQMCSEILRTKMCQALILNYDSLLNQIYIYWNVYISFQHRDEFNQTTENSTNNALIVQETKENLSQIDSKVMVSSLKIIKRLKVVNLEDNNIDDDAAIQLADHLYCNNVLEQLWLRGNELYDNGASVVLQSLCNLSTLLILDLSFNHLSSESADGIAVVIGNNCSLQQLWLDGNDLLTRGIVIIANALKKLSSLRILSLCSNGITDNAAEEISNVITNNVLLVDLSLGNNQLQATGVCKIAVALRKLVVLRKLDLFNSQITSDAAEELAVTLSNCTNLQQLFLSDNMLGNEGTIRIADALKCINSLQMLTFSNNNITESAADKLVNIIKNNISLKIILIGGNDLQTTGISLIAQIAKSISTLQLLDVSDNNVSEEEKEKFKTIFVNDNFTIVV